MKKLVVFLLVVLFAAGLGWLSFWLSGIPLFTEDAGRWSVLIHISAVLCALITCEALGKEL